MIKEMFLRCTHAVTERVKVYSIPSAMFFLHFSMATAKNVLRYFRGVSVTD